MKARSRTPASFVTVKLSDERIDRIWRAVESGTLPRKRRVRWLAVAAIVVTALVLFWQQQRHEPSQVAIGADDGPASGDWFATGAAGKIIALRNGNRLELGRSSQLRIMVVSAAETRIRLERGEVFCHVPHLDGRSLVVEAGTTEVRVIGTEFRVALEMKDTGPALSVDVGEGRVEVADGTTTSVLTAGQRWSSAPLLAAQPSASASALPVAPPPASIAPAPTRRSPKALWAHAQRARLAGRTRVAARAYDALRRQHPNDGRAGLSAFELGRIRLDSLGDANGALEAFDFALAHANDAFFAEDAEAGRVEALSRMGSARACKNARAAFLDKHAHSAHAARLGRLCGEAKTPASDTAHSP